jgi:multiple sugar transport system permease protein
MAAVLSRGAHARPSGRSGARKRRTVRLALVYLTATVLGLMFMAPFFWTLSTGLKGSWEVLAFPPTVFPREVRWANFVEVFTRVPFATWAVNSVAVADLSALGTVLSAALVAFGFARVRFPGRGPLFMLVLSTMMLPTQVTIIPLFLGYRIVGWLDTLAPLVVPHWFVAEPSTSSCCASSS